MLTIRLRRAGKRHQPTYRVVVVEHTVAAQGSYLESVGTYNPRAGQFSVKEDRVVYWLDHGAQPSERMSKLLTTAGVKHKLIVLPDYSKKPQRKPKKEAPAEKAPVVDSAPPKTEEPVAEPTETTEQPEAVVDAPAEVSTDVTNETPAPEESTSAEGETPEEEK